jgi:hypothetical protein
VGEIPVFYLLREEENIGEKRITAREVCFGGNLKGG